MSSVQIVETVTAVVPLEMRALYRLDLDSIREVVREEIERSQQPREFVPLTDDEIAEAMAGVLGLPHDIKVELARAVERAHGIGGQE